MRRVLASVTLSDALGNLVRRYRAGRTVGISSVCSAHPLVADRDSGRTIEVRRVLETEAHMPLLSQAMPVQYARIREGARAPEPRALVIDHVCDVLRAYGRACGVIATGEENHTP